MEGNSIIPSEAEHDDHHDHRCLGCAIRFTAAIRPAAQTTDGDICQQCWEEREDEE
jgi:hypothetical protein